MPSLNQFVRWGNVALLVLTLLSYLSPYLNPNRFWLISIFGLLFPVFFVLNLFFILYWLSRKKWYFLLSAACLGLGWSFLTKNINFKSPSAATEKSFKVMTYNSLNAVGFYEKGTKYKERLGNFFSYIQSHDPDIVCLQEFGISTKQIEEFLTQVYPNSSERPRYYGAKGASPLILTTFPIIDKGALAFQNATNGCIYLDLNIHGETVRVYNVHLKSNTITQIADKVKEEGDFREKETWQKIRQMFAGYKANAQIRATQVQEIRKHIAQCPYPVIICGDFNDVPQSYAYQTIAQGLSDHFQESGQGIGTTFGGSIPFLRIDYILSSPKITSSKTYIVRDDYSDHFPVVSILDID